MWDNLTVKGFHFNSSAEYADAKHEAETIDYICSRMDVTDPEVALKVYIKLLDRQTFHTIVGMCFLKELRDRVLASGSVDEEELKTIHAPAFASEDDSTEVGDREALLNSEEASEYASSVEGDIPADSGDDPEKPGDTVRKLNRELSEHIKREGKAADLNDYLHTRIKKLYLLIAGLIVVIAVLFIIAIHNNNLVFVDEELALQDKYSAWEEDLTAREKALQEKEAAINE